MCKIVDKSGILKTLSYYPSRIVKFSTDHHSIWLDINKVKCARILNILATWSQTSVLPRTELALSVTKTEEIDHLNFLGIIQISHILLNTMELNSATSFVQYEEEVCEDHSASVGNASTTAFKNIWLKYLIFSTVDLFWWQNVNNEKNTAESFFETSTEDIT